MSVVSASQKKLTEELRRFLSMEAESAWFLKDGLGYETVLPRPREIQSTTINIGVLGTRRRCNVSNYGWAKSKTDLMAAMFASLNHPICVIDVRRSGCGGQGAWGPDEFQNTIPDKMKLYTTHPYSYRHLPVVAPERQLLQTSRSVYRNQELKAKLYRTTTIDQIVQVARLVEAGETVRNPDYYLFWQVFSAYYKRSILQNDKINIPLAFVEYVAAMGGWPFLCVLRNTNPGSGT